MRLEILALVASSSFVMAAREIVNPARQEKYTSGAVMDGIMERKYVSSSWTQSHTMASRFC